MKEFRINEKISILAQSEEARNRTWESYEFQSVSQRLIDKTSALSPAEKQVAYNFLKGDHTDWSGVHATAGVAQMGDLLTKNKVESNIWKKRMLTAGLGNQGLEFPEGFDKLDEKTKGKRLDMVINELAGFGKQKKTKTKKQVSHASDIEKKINKMVGL
jgi:hypothetical protein